MSEAVLRVSGLCKAFGQNRVLRGLDLKLYPGSVTVLMGANGAGKSTLVKVICGYYSADEGELLLDNKPYQPNDSADAITQGVVTVHQSIDDGVIPDLDVANNLLLDRLARSDAPLLVRDRAMRKEASAIAASMGLSMDVSTRVADLGVADRQMIAIARAMARAPKLLILDEPTSSLSAAEADRLFSLIDRLRDQGVAILYISHRMSDIRRIADRIICMRDGKISGLFEGPALDYEGAVTAMLGRQMTDADIEPVAAKAPILELKDISLIEGAQKVNMSVGDGEVVAVTGLLGSGKSRLSEIIFGLSKSPTGSMILDGKRYAPKDAKTAVKSGVYMSPKDRAANAVIPEFDIANNMTLPFLGSFCKLSLLSPRAQRGAADSMIGQIGVVCQSNEDGINTLSGGNQQKVMIGRWLIEPSRVLLLDEPFQGVDIGARRDIGRHIRATAKGRATIVFVAEIDEALEIADRILVLHEGAINGEHKNLNIDLTALVSQVSGQSTTEQVAV
ncbi:monosaccharide ABC transporter ATP-binding protein, CUT2 family [Cohaesibacter sp. ES.047]|uniref:sugar ABC transporter ATP-binding protein n=1 Tax=Cohaesibacter sp. ES.047 TaxID=1798205 RepID=UPI000BB7CB1E|nr:sugar ABC transporter ATP-binding protein [Cohaesibacter sp. ES.047]SNY90232.1 monosaccharide ABC transporter ATP-binding protein, CUT2 family [Cohaesibacter sp. ES.047]